jgi:hypothetical protein
MKTLIDIWQDLKTVALMLSAILVTAAVIWAVAFLFALGWTAGTR